MWGQCMGRSFSTHASTPLVSPPLASHLLLGWKNGKAKPMWNRFALAPSFLWWCTLWPIDAVDEHPLTNGCSKDQQRHICCLDSVQTEVKVTHFAESAKMLVHPKTLPILGSANKIVNLFAPLPQPISECTLLLSCSCSLAHTKMIEKKKIIGQDWGGVMHFLLLLWILTCLTLIQELIQWDPDLSYFLVFHMCDSQIAEPVRKAHFHNLSPSLLVKH